MLRFVIFLTFFQNLSFAAGTTSAHWYKITQNHRLIGISNEVFSKKSGTIHVQTDFWRRKGDVWVREHVGAMAARNKNLTPRIYQHYLHTESRYIDAIVRVSKDWELERSVQKGKAKLPSTRIQIPPNTIWSTMLPLWIQSHRKELLSGMTLSFNALVEELLTTPNPVKKGQVKFISPDTFAQKHGFSKLEIKYNNRTHLWWIRKDGLIIRAEIPEKRLIMQLISAKSAKAFLDSSNISDTSDAKTP